MKTIVTDEFDSDPYINYRRSYTSVMFQIASALSRAGSFGNRNG